MIIENCKGILEEIRRENLIEIIGEKKVEYGLTDFGVMYLLSESDKFMASPNNNGAKVKQK